jgi:hypothetical protein
MYEEYDVVALRPAETGQLEAESVVRGDGVDGDLGVGNAGSGVTGDGGALLDRHDCPL